MSFLSLLRRPSVLASVALHGALGVVAFAGTREPVPVSRPAMLEGIWTSDATGAADLPDVPPPPDMVPTPEEIPVAAPLEVLPPPEEDLSLPDPGEDIPALADLGPGLPPIGVRRLPPAVAVPSEAIPHAPQLPSVSVSASAPAAPAIPQPFRPPSSASRAGTRVSRDASALATNAPPAYPAEALRNGWEGTVLVEVRTDAMGAVVEATLARSSGFAVLDGSALAAVRSWQFAPRLVDGVPAPDWFHKPVVFSLRSPRR